MFISQDVTEHMHSKKKTWVEWTMGDCGIPNLGEQ